jgi:cell division protease FtsH
VNLRRIAQMTVYFSGADLANVCNEAALLAARRNKEKVGMEEMLAAVERVTMGPEKKSHVTSKKEKEMTAYHEAGHALLSLLIDEVDTFTKVSIIPRGMAGGYTLTPPKEDKHYMSKKELKGMMVVLLGGMVGEEIYMDDTTTGVSNDLQRVSQIARSMVCQYGMSDKLDKLAFGKQNQQMFLGRDLFAEKDYSEETSRKIDEEIHNLVHESYEKAKKLLFDHRDKMDVLAKRLIEKETIDIEEARVLLMLPEHKLNLHTDVPQNP